MKRTFTIIGLAVFLVAGMNIANAQSPSYGAQTLWTTNGAGIPAATAVAGNAVIDCRKQAKVAVQITAQSDTSGAAIGLCFVPSLDGSTYGSSTVGASAYHFVSFTPAQTATTVVTNLDTFGAGYMKLLYITNTTGAACTNISVKYAVKVSAP